MNKTDYSKHMDERGGIVKQDEILYGVEIPGLYDGVAFWVMKDGSRVNRWAGLEGYEFRAAAVQKEMDAWES